MNNPKYQNRPIYSIRSLALSLGINEQLLINTAANSDDYFQLNQQTKKDGSLRDCYNLKEPLKTIHKQLRKKLISKVEYPEHTQGSIKGCSNITNAKLHEKSKTIIQLDIKDFFPSISSKYIYNVWRYFFHFSDNVSELLTSLVTLNNQFIQGSPLSSDIANLIFWDKEYQLVNNLTKLNLVYSRYVDDINISSKNKITDTLKTDIIKQVNSMLKSKGLKLKNNKTKILNESSQMLVTGLVVNKSVKASQKYINSVYKEINNNPNQISIIGKINYIKQTTPKKAISLEKAYKKSLQRTASSCPKAH